MPRRNTNRPVMKHSADSCFERAVRRLRLIGLGVMIAVALVGCDDAALTDDDSRADPKDIVKVALGEKVYLQTCAACHGIDLRGQPDWRRRLSNGRRRAPPHDDSGHTWHHPDPMLFAIIKDGLVPPNAPPDYTSDMPAFGQTLSDEQIWGVLAYIKSHWSTATVSYRAKRLANARKR